MATRAEMRIALTLVREYKQAYANYLVEVAEYRAQGYRARFCEHGTNQWTDYDNICGGCESGVTSRGIGAYEAAMSEAVSLVWEAYAYDVMLGLYRWTESLKADCSAGNVAAWEAWSRAQDTMLYAEAWRMLPGYYRERAAKEAVQV